jgi:hypothetical protein
MGKRNASHDFRVGPDVTCRLAPDHPLARPPNLPNTGVQPISSLVPQHIRRDGKIVLSIEANEKQSFQSSVVAAVFRRRFAKPAFLSVPIVAISRYERSKPQEIAKLLETNSRSFSEPSFSARFISNSLTEMPSGKNCQA